MLFLTTEVEMRVKNSTRRDSQYSLYLIFIVVASKEENKGRTGEVL